MDQARAQATTAIEAQDIVSVDAYIQGEFVNLFLHQNHRAQVGIAFASAVIASVWASVGDKSLAWYWFSAMLLVCIARYTLTSRWVRGGTFPTAHRRVALALLPGALLMCVPLLWFGSFPATERAALTIILLALGTASVATTAGYRHLYLFYVGPTLFSLGLAWMAVEHSGHGGLAEVGVGLLILGYLAFLVGLARDARQVFDSSCRIRFKERALNAELKVALAVADEASHVKTQFMAAASHDLRQPLHGLHVLLAALSLRPLDLRSQEILKLLDNLSASMNTQMNGLLEVCKLDSGIIEPRLVSVALEQVLATHHAEMIEVARAQGVALVLQADTPLTAVTDPDLLLRVVRNLTDNALKFTPVGTVTLSLARVDSTAIIAVKDSGIGIAPENQARVFNEFFRVADNDHARVGGMGLGLAIVHRLCKLLNIEVRLASELGRGTEITLILRLPGQ